MIKASLLAMALLLPSSLALAQTLWPNMLGGCPGLCSGAGITTVFVLTDDSGTNLLTDDADVNLLVGQ